MRFGHWPERKSPMVPDQLQLLIELTKTQITLQAATLQLMLVDSQADKKTKEGISRVIGLALDTTSTDAAGRE
jgi:hypothetical protein